LLSLSAREEPDAMMIVRVVLYFVLMTGLSLRERLGRVADVAR
jgi:hypothetical protein